MNPEKAIKGFDTWHKFKHPEGPALITHYGRAYLNQVKEYIRANLKSTTRVMQAVGLSKEDVKTILHGEDEKEVAETILQNIGKDPTEPLAQNGEASEVKKLRMMGLLVKDDHHASPAETVKLYSRLLESLRKSKINETNPTGQYAASFTAKPFTQKNATVMIHIPLVHAIINKKLVMPYYPARQIDEKNESERNTSHEVGITLSKAMGKGIMPLAQNLLIIKEQKDGKETHHIIIIDPEHLFK